ncbi:MAG: tetratricopeptide repeat protein [Pirellulaceae bacterium]
MRRVTKFGGSLVSDSAESQRWPFGGFHPAPAKSLWLVLLLGLLTVGLPGMARAEGEGQADLDEATVARIDATTASDLEEVATLLESALAKGLDDDNASFARKMLGAVSFQHGQAVAQQIMQNRGRGLAQLRQQAVTLLEKAVKYDPSLGEAHLLMARLSALPGGDQDRAKEAATSAIEHLSGEKKLLGEAYVLRALLHEENEAKLDDLNKAIEADPNSEGAYQGRALIHMQNGDTEKAVDDLRKLIDLNPTNTAIAVETVRALLQLDRVDEAKKLLTDALREKPTADLYRLRAVILQTEGKSEEAEADLAKALSLDPSDFAALLMRAEIFMGKGDMKSAKEDVKKALSIEPGSVQGIFMRSLVASDEGRLADAINDMRLLVSEVPENVGFSMQLANLYQLDERPRKAIEVIDGVLEREPDNWRALRTRGDARLSIAEHAKAIEDYEQALKLTPDDPDGKSGVLNNLAWVLATSPLEEVRDGERALTLAKEAAELTEYKEAHILSTLAAAHAETGNFEEAIKWASEAVEAGKKEENPQLEQLQQELESYRKDEPWREKQETEENEVPILSPEEIIDT